MCADRLTSVWFVLWCCHTFCYCVCYIIVIKSSPPALASSSRMFFTCLCGCPLGSPVSSQLSQTFIDWKLIEWPLVCVCGCVCGFTLTLCDCTDLLTSRWMDISGHKVTSFILSYNVWCPSINWHLSQSVFLSHAQDILMIPHSPEQDKAVNVPDRVLVLPLCKCFAGLNLHSAFMHELL